jgi:hypothetical protein
MKKLLSVCAFFALTGCAAPSVPVTMKFPAAPTELLKLCPDLNLVDPNTDKLSVVLGVVSDNYITYYECKSKVGDWIEWYNSQKVIFDRISK